MTRRSFPPPPIGRRKHLQSTDGFFTLRPAIPVESARSISVVALVLFVVLSLLASVASVGFLEADGCTHYLYARYAFHEPQYLFNVWGRPICTLFYAVGAQFGGRFGVRCISLLCAIGIAFVAKRISEIQKDSAKFLALICLLAQPLLFLHSFSELTELPFALLLGIAFIAFQLQRWWMLALFASVLPMARPEGFAILFIVAVVLPLRRRWLACLLLPLPMIFWSYFGWRTFGCTNAYPWWLWLPHNWPYAEHSAYATKSIFHFAALMPAITSPLLFPGLLVGIWRSAKALRAARNWREHRLHCEATILFLPLAILVGHSVLTATGRMASNGELRYMLVAAPFWAVLTARGWQFIFRWNRWRFSCVAALAAAMVPVVVNRVYIVIPLNFAEDWLAAERTADWLNHTPLRKQYPMLAACHPGVDYFLDISPTDSSRIVAWHRRELLVPRDGTILVWNWVYGTHNSSMDLVIPIDELEKAGWIRIDVPRVQAAERIWDKEFVLLSPRDKDGHATVRPRQVTALPNFEHR